MVENNYLIVDIINDKYMWRSLPVLDNEDEDGVAHGENDDDNHQGAGNAIVRRSQTAIESKTMFVGLLMLRMSMIMMVMVRVEVMMIIMMRLMMK